MGVKMTKGTSSRGKRHTKSHAPCRRCGKKSFHKQKKQCSSCGMPNKKMRSFNWSIKAQRRRKEGTGRMRYVKIQRRRAKNGYQPLKVKLPSEKTTESK